MLARLEQENNALATDPKSALVKTPGSRQSRPPSIQHLQKLVNDPRSSLRYSRLPPPPMTELEFWAALVADYPSTAQRLPTLTSNKIRAGVPAPLRGVVWPSIAGARDTQLFEEFGRLCGESSPYENLIGKDIGRSFPNVEMFRDPNGEGQQMLARVLKCFSLYDSKIGYCQGLGFVVGPLLMHMTDAESFSVLIRYDLTMAILSARLTSILGSWNTTTSAHASFQTCQGCTYEFTNSKTYSLAICQPSSPTWKHWGSSPSMSRSGSCRSLLLLVRCLCFSASTMSCSWRVHRRR